MHAKYAFLVDSENWPAQFEEYNLETLDVNNWSQEMMLVTKDGEVTQLAGDDDFRERYHLANEFMLLPKERRWESAMDLVKKINLSEVKMALSLEEFDQENAEGALREALALAAVKEEDTYRLCLLSNALYYLKHSTGPFYNGTASPYEWRTMTLHEDGDAILFVDIHT